MNFRSHLARSFGFRYPTHRLILGVGAIVGVVALVGWLNDTKTVGVLLAPVYVGVVWALMREIDPDNDWTAIVAGAFAGWWVLQQHPVVSALAVGAMAVSARIMSETTGRRPLLSDLIVVAILGIGVGYTVAGWVAGLGVAAAMVVDHRRAERRLRIQPWIALATAVGASANAWITGVELTAGAVSAKAASAAAVAAFILIIRRPVPPTSLVDARRKTPILQNRLHASRAVTAIVVYGMAVTLNSLDAVDLTPLLVALALVVISNEVEGITRKG
jgi:hypothetical protein